MTQPNWDDLRLFLEVSRYPRLAEAAKRLGVDATTIGRRLRRLEQDLGSILFERTPKGHVLTAAGVNLTQRVESLEQLTREITSEIAGETERASGRVRLSVTEGFGTAVMAPAVHEFIKAFPKIDLDLISTNGFLSVSKREADMSVLLTRPETGRLKARKLADYYLYLYGSCEYLAEHGHPETIDDLNERTFIGYVDDLIFSPKMKYYSEVGPGVSPRLCSSSLISQLQMVRSGCGLAALPAFLADELPDLELVLPDQVQIQRSLWLATHEDIVGLARIKAVSEFIVDLVTSQKQKLLGYRALQN
ncbi:MAG: LysR family transcriptional regulator [Hirschia sp.]|nr:LysR family transcriptional regulator [Hirschia sp.]MBF19268.1 LysR family transcriptional regulator [Hirschia sp.]